MYPNVKRWLTHSTFDGHTHTGPFSGYLLAKAEQKIDLNPFPDIVKYKTYPNLARPQLTLADAVNLGLSVVA